MYKLKIEIIPRTLYFKRPARTSRGVYTERKVWYLRMTSPDLPGRIGVGECAPLPGLSSDCVPDYEQILTRFCKRMEEDDEDYSVWEEMMLYPSMAFGLKAAGDDFSAEAPGDTDFARGYEGIPINGLVWMGDRADMFEQVKQKIEAGFRCIKIKIGGLDFEEELGLLRYVRQQFASTHFDLRLDANGAFAPSEALEKLKRLSDFRVHSIEQPIPAGHWDEMADLVRQSPIAIALDEELIGYYSIKDQEKLLDHIHPHYIVVKPMLHGELEGWVEKAEMKGIGWWATSALESNIGLHAIANWVSYCKREDETLIPQGLGTGMLFKENVPVPFVLKGDELWYNPKEDNNYRLSL